jgi:hypothetical protein
MLNTKSIKKQNKEYKEINKELIQNDDEDNSILLNNEEDNFILLNNEVKNMLESNILDSIIILNNEGLVNKNDIKINKIESPEILNENCIIFNENKNGFVINDDTIVYTILKSDIINYIINLSTNESSIKKYIFIISFNNITNTNEFNFINNTIFTKNLNMMIKLQNLLYENINRDDFYKNDIVVKNKFLMFYYQLVIFMFKSSYNNILFDKNKIMNTYSTLSFRISTIILKETFILQHKYENVSQELDNIKTMKNSMHVKLNQLSKQINIIQDETDETDVSDKSDISKKHNISISEPSEIIMSLHKVIEDDKSGAFEPNKSKNIKETDNSIIKIENLIDSLTSSIIEMENKKEETRNNLSNDDNLVKSEKGISKNMLDSLSFNSENKYEEIDETSEPSNHNINDLNDLNILNISSMSDGTMEKSYNSKSVINNGKIYFNP